MRYLILLLFLSATITSCDKDPILEDELYYDGANSNAPNFDAGLFIPAVEFPSSLLNDYSGEEIRAVKFYMYDAPVSAEVVIFNSDEGSFPGTEIYRGSYNSLQPGAWNVHVLSESLLIDGNSLVIGISIENDETKQVMGCDAGPRDSRGGDWLFEDSDSDWLSFLDRSTDSINWNIRAELK